jgi:hypothetical protein
VTFTRYYTSADRDTLAEVVVSEEVEEEWTAPRSSPRTAFMWRTADGRWLAGLHDEALMSSYPIGNLTDYEARHFFRKSWGSVPESALPYFGRTVRSAPQ